MLNFIHVVISLINVVSFIHFQREEKLEDLNLLFINIHHLINELRPHQVNIILCFYFFFAYFSLLLLTESVKFRIWDTKILPF